MKERRRVERTKYTAMNVIIICDTEEKYYIKIENVSPLGMGIRMPAGSPDIVGKDVIVVAECVVMFAVVRRMVPGEDGSIEVGIEGKPFTEEMLKCLYENVGKGS
ncbi:MAG: hypothetical protein NC517_04830 [Firmicutes bacterium]|nr:hypothetical protein [Bacillota bacterium]